MSNKTDKRFISLGYSIASHKSIIRDIESEIPRIKDENRSIEASHAILLSLVERVKKHSKDALSFDKDHGGKI